MATSQFATILGIDEEDLAYQEHHILESLDYNLFVSNDEFSVYEQQYAYSFEEFC